MYKCHFKLNELKHVLGTERKEVLGTKQKSDLAVVLNKNAILRVERNSAEFDLRRNLPTLLIQSFLQRRFFPEQNLLKEENTSGLAASEISMPAWASGNFSTNKLFKSIKGKLGSTMRPPPQVQQ
jgi:hypothetical protein